MGIGQPLKIFTKGLPHGQKRGSLLQHLWRNQKLKYKSKQKFIVLKTTGGSPSTVLMPYPLHISPTAHLSLARQLINPNPCGYINWRCRTAWSHIWLPGDNRREGGDTSCRGRSQEAPGLHLERARHRAGGSRTAWHADFWRGECPALGWWWRGHIYLHGRMK